MKREGRLKLRHSIILAVISQHVMGGGWYTPRDNYTHCMLPNTLSAIESASHINQQQRFCIRVTLPKMATLNVTYRELETRQLATRLETTQRTAPRHCEVKDEISRLFTPKYVHRDETCFETKNSYTVVFNDISTYSAFVTKVQWLRWIVCSRRSIQTQKYWLPNCRAI